MLSEKAGSVHSPSGREICVLDYQGFLTLRSPESSVLVIMRLTAAGVLTCVAFVLVRPQSDKDGYDCHGSTRNDTEKSILWPLFFRVFPCASVAIK